MLAGNLDLWVQVYAGIPTGIPTGNLYKPAPVSSLNFQLHISLHFQLYSRVGLYVQPDFLALPILYVRLAKRMTNLYHFSRTLHSDQPDHNTSYPFDKKTFFVAKVNNLLDISLSFSVPASLRNIPIKYNIIVGLWTYAYAFHKLLKSLHRGEVLFHSAGKNKIQPDTHFGLVLHRLDRLLEPGYVITYPAKYVVQELQKHRG